MSVKGERPVSVSKATKRPCPKCGREFLPAGYGRHVPLCAGSRSATGARPPAPSGPAVDAARPASTDGACAQCLFRGLERHLDQDLVRRAVVGGMTLDAACALVRDIKAAMGR